MNFSKLWGESTGAFGQFSCEICANYFSIGQREKKQSSGKYMVGEVTSHRISPAILIIVILWARRGISSSPADRKM